MRESGGDRAIVARAQSGLLARCSVWSGNSRLFVWLASAQIPFSKGNSCYLSDRSAPDAAALRSRAPPRQNPSFSRGLTLPRDSVNAFAKLSSIAPRWTAALRTPPRLEWPPVDDLEARPAGLLADVFAMTITLCWTKCSFVEHAASSSQVQYPLTPVLTPTRSSPAACRSCRAPPSLPATVVDFERATHAKAAMDRGEDDGIEEWLVNDVKRAIDEAARLVIPETITSTCPRPRHGSREPPCVSQTEIRRSALSWASG
jgi:hypothetical protein